MNDSDKYAHKKTRDASILKHPEFSISFLFMPYRYLLCFLLLITHKSVPEDDELTDERNEPGELP